MGRSKSSAHGKWRRYVDIEGEDGSVLRVPMAVNAHRKNRSAPEGYERALRAATVRKQERHAARSFTRLVKEYVG